MGAYSDDSHAGFWAYVTVSGGTPTLQSSYNVTGITDSGVGILTVTVATDFASANWAVAATSANTNSSATNASFVSEDSDLRTAGVCVLCNYNGAATQAAADPVAWSVSGFGVQ